MNAVKVLTKDHEKVKGFFRKFEQTGGRSRQRTTLADKIFQELEVHTKVEEEIFYPAMKKINREMVADSLEDHRTVSGLIRELRGMEPDDEEYEDKFQELIENVESHAEEEEREMFPQAEEELADDLNRLGDEIQQRKRQLVSASAS